MDGIRAPRDLQLRSVLYSDAPDLRDSGKCQRCFRAGAECLLVTSRRGGRRTRGKSNESAIPVDFNRPILPASDQLSGAIQSSTSASTSPSNVVPRSSSPLHSQSTDTTIIENTFASTSLHDTSDALNFLSHIASNNIDRLPLETTADLSRATAELSDNLDIVSEDDLEYRLVKNGSLTRAQILMLLQR